MVSRFLLVFLISIFLGQPCLCQDDSSDDSKSLIELMRDLRETDQLRTSGNPKEVKERLQQKIEIINEILQRDDLQESQRVIISLARLQSHSAFFSINFRQKQLDEKQIEEYEEAISDGLSDRAPEIVLESLSTNASLKSGVYILSPTESNADQAVEALRKLKDYKPEISLVQSKRRLLMEQLWESEKPRLIFEKMKTSDESIAKIVLAQLDGDTEKEVADFKWTKHFARKKDLISMRRLASMYESGDGTRRNYSQAARWHTKLSQLGDVKSKIKLGDYYLQGRGYSQNAETAVELYRETAKAGSRVGQFKLAECYLNGQGVKKSEDNWKRWIKAAALNARPVEVQDVYSSVDFTKSADSYVVFYESLVDQYPDDVYYLNNLAYSLLINSKKDPERSLELINQALDQTDEEFPGRSNFVDTKATALMQLDRTEEAINLFESILEDLDNKKPTLKSLIKCYERIDSSKADKYREQLDQLEN